jgi:hypothetical protein
MDIINPLEYPNWDRLLLASPGYSFFHTSFWASVLHDSYNYLPRYLVRIHDGKMTDLLPIMEVRSALTGRRGVSLPFTDYCDPIISDHSKLERLLEFLKIYGEKEKWRYFELRGGEDLLGKVPSSSFYYCHVLKLSTDVDGVYAHLKSGIKRNIKKAMREGVVVTHSSTLDAVKTFYHLHCQTRRKHGIPPQPFNFFQRIYDHIISCDHGHVVLAVHQGKPIAGAIYLHFGNEAIYKFGASDSEYLHLRPNDLLMWEAIQWYCRHGYTRFSFGRTDPDNEGLRRFKNGWGTDEKVIRYFKYDISKKEFKTEKTSNGAITLTIFRKMPIFLSELVGKVLYRHVG